MATAAPANPTSIDTRAPAISSEKHVDAAVVGAQPVLRSWAAA